MKTKLIFFILLFTSTTLFSQNRTIYIWETPVTHNVSAPHEMVNELRKEIDTLLKYNALAPLRVFYGDVIWETYFSYLEPARSILTLARSYKHLTASQRTMVAAYIREELSNPISSPWLRMSNPILSRTEGIRREYHLLDKIWGSDNVANYDNRPVLHLLYGLWLYAFNSNDYDLIEENWSEIKQYYQSYKNRELNLLSGIGAAIAVARMAEIMNDSQMLQTAVDDINNNLLLQGLIDSAKDFAYNGFSGWDAPYPYNTDRARNLIFMGWIYLNISPELCRFLDDYYYSQVIADHNNEIQKFPLWWVRSVPYFSRWTGDESIGISSEVCGMASPIERWILDRDANSFSLYTRSVPYCVGDYHWLEMLVDNIELYGQTDWVDVRTFNDTIPPNQISDLRIEYQDSSAYLIWTTPEDNGLNGRPFGYWFRFSNEPIDENLWNQYQLIEYNQTVKSAGEQDTLKISNLGNDSTYYIAVKAYDDFDNLSLISNIVVLDNSLVDIKDEIKIKDYFICDVYPNPFNPKTNIRVNLTSSSTLSISVFSIVGELVDKLIDNKIFVPGEHNFKFDALNLSSGVYIINISAKDNNTSNTTFKSIKAVLVK